ncbi:hypothetical protein ACJX0J_042522, partial [Zea mays]
LCSVVGDLTIHFVGYVGGPVVDLGKIVHVILANEIAPSHFVLFPMFNTILCLSGIVLIGEIGGMAEEDVVTFIQNYFSCFFPLPIVISSLRWGLEASRKTVVATVLLLFTLSGPVKASTYL